MNEVQVVLVVNCCDVKKLILIIIFSNSILPVVGSMYILKIPDCFFAQAILRDGEMILRRKVNKNY